MDVSARVTMKDAAKCDKRCEWQNSANQKKAERILHFWVPPESMSSSGRWYFNETENAISLSRVVIWFSFLCVSVFHIADASNFSDCAYTVQFRSSLERYIFTIFPRVSWGLGCAIRISNFVHAWSESRVPAEFKHISKRRKRKWTWFP